MLRLKYKYGSIVSVNMDVVGVMAAYLPVVRVCSSLYRKAPVPSCTVKYTHTHHGSEYAAITPTTSMSTDTIEP